MIKRLAHKVFRVLRNLYRLNWFATLYVNFRLLPISQAIKLPIFCYGRFKYHCLSGRFLIDGPVHNGMIQLGYRWIDLFPVSYLPTQLCIRGSVKFHGHAILSGGVALFAQSKESVITLGKDITLGGGTLIKSMNSITISQKTRITGGCTVMDSNMHFVKNISTGKIAQKTGSIFIGNNCWINYSSVITKGAYIPSYSIVARNSFVGKNLKDEGENLFIAGMPAKVINHDVQRIFDYDREAELSDFFIKNPDCPFYQDSIGIKDETIPFDLI